MEPRPPQQQIAQMLTGYWVSQALYVAAKLGLADLLKDGPRTADDLAAATQSHPRR
jgi:methyltransferase family protein